MKIRTGFVSNSSSSSFCLVGASVYDVEITALAKTLDLEMSTAKDEWDRNYENMKKVSEALEKEGLEVYEGEDQLVFGYEVKTDTTIDSQIKWAVEEFKALGIKQKPCFDYGEVSSG